MTDAAESWAVAGFAARFVSAYLGADVEDAAGLTEFLGHTPEATAAASGPVEPPDAVAVVAVDPTRDAVWAVTVSARTGHAETYWRVGVTSAEGSGLVALGLPAPAPRPTTGERAALAVVLSSIPPVDDTAVDTVAGFVAAYACGDGDLSRYVTPGAALAALTPAVCTEARIVRWGTRADGDDRSLVLAEVVLDPDTTARRIGLTAGAGATGRSVGGGRAAARAAAGRSVE